MKSRSLVLSLALVLSLSIDASASAQDLGTSPLGGVQKAAAAAEEVEPNNSPKLATLVDPAAGISGSLGIQQVDYFRFSIRDGGQVRDFGFDLASEVRIDMCLFDDKATRIKCSRGLRSVFEEMALDGDYIVSLATVARTEAAIPYRLRFSAPRDRKPNHEVEPNDRWADAIKIDTGTRISGLLQHGDHDSFHFSVRGKQQLWQIDATGGATGMVLKSIGGIAMQNRSSQHPDLQMSNLLLRPGDYVVGVTRNQNRTQQEDYTLHVRPMGEPDTITAGKLTSDANASKPQGRIEYEPNDSNGQAMRLRFDEARIGLLGKGDTDMYRFFLAGQGRVRVTAVPPAGGTLNLSFDSGPGAKGDGVDTPTVFEGELPPGDHYLQVRSRPPGNGLYQIVMTQIDPLVSDAATTDDIKLTLIGKPQTLAAYQPIGQRLTLGMDVVNSGASAKTLDVVTASSDYTWRLTPDQEKLSLAPGQRKRVAVNLDVLADARADQPSLMSLGVRDASGAVTSTTLELNAACEAPTVNPRQIWPLPDALLGRINAAAIGLGAKVVGDDGVHLLEAFDSEVGPAVGAWTKRNNEGAIRVDLAGDAPVTVIGTIIHPVGNSKRGARLREFEILTSMDGENFSLQHKGTLRQDPHEQAIVFSKPVKARFAEIRMLNNYDGRSVLSFGEWKVIVNETAQEITGEALNIAGNEIGGYDAYSDPFAGGSCCHETFSTAEADGQLGKTATHYEWVMGFTDNRAAKITEFKWIDHEKRGYPARDLVKVNVAISMSSPLGPWHPLGEWNIERDAASVKPWSLKEPVWARFVRFQAAPLESGNAANAPQQVQIIEQASSDTYQSVIAEWGYTNREAIYEKLNPPKHLNHALGKDSNDTRSRATTLTPGKTAAGQVLIDEDVDWYAVDVPAGNNQLRLVLRGDPSIDYAFEVQDADGNVLDTEDRELDDGLELTAAAGPGRYYLKIYEPIRSFVFAWDTSGSVGRFYDVIDHTMKTFAGGVKTGREEVNLLPFNDGVIAFLLKDWSGNSNEVLTEVVNSDRKYDSSDVERALTFATSELEDREGTRAVILITDAITDGYSQTATLWTWLKRVQPRIFAFDIGSAGNYTAQNQMQSYADVNNGFYDQTFSAGALQVGFDRAVCMLRRPKSYSVVAHLDTVEAKPPGELLVTLEETAEKSVDDAVEVILDASGSMFQKLGDRFRYEIAKEVLDDLVATTIPDDIGFALRVFGNRDASSCRTDLEVPLAPLDRAAARKVIAAIEPQPYAYTPIADSLQHVAEDLQDVKGRRTVVLVTDGEESCDGDVVAVIEELKAGGIDVQLNVIGFDFDADDKEAARSQFREWASLGGGSYFDATNAEELAESLAQAVSAPMPYDVINANGDVIASGIINGEIMTVPVGTYTLRAADPDVAEQKVSIRSAVRTEAQLKRQ